VQPADALPAHIAATACQFRPLIVIVFGFQDGRDSDATNDPVRHVVRDLRELVSMATPKVEGVGDPSLRNPVRRGARRGLFAGLIAGVILLLAEVLAAVAAREPPFTPLRMAASVVLGRGALADTAPGTVSLAGLVVHFLLAGVFGMLYGELRSRVQGETSWALDALRGLAYGAVLWLIDFQLLARLLAPWFLETSQVVQLVLHALFYGVPLGIACGRTPVSLHTLERQSPI